MAANRLCGLGARLGVPCSAAEMAASLRPADYCYQQPSAEVLARLRAALAPGGPNKQPDDQAGFQGAAAGTPTLAPAAPAAAAPAAPGPSAPVDDPFAGTHLGLDLDDDCLRLLLGEGEDAGAAASACGKPGSGGASEKSSATAEDGAADADAASRLPLGPHKEEDDDIAMLFGELRGPASQPLDPLELQLLGAAHLAAVDDSDSASQAAGAAAAEASDAAEAAADAGAGLKRFKVAGGSPGLASPGGRGGLRLSMNYEAAAESINFELLAGRKATCGGEAADAPLPLLSPGFDFALGACTSSPSSELEVGTPESPDSLASASDTAMPPAPLDALMGEPMGKRKRAAVAAA